MQRRRENPEPPPPKRRSLFESAQQAASDVAQNDFDDLSRSADANGVGVTDPPIKLPTFVDAATLHEQIVAELRAQKVKPRNPVQTKADISPPPTGAGAGRCGFSAPSLTAPDNIGAGLRGQMEAWVNAVHCPPVPE
jgi:hypothetical protein